MADTLASRLTIVWVARLTNGDSEARLVVADSEEEACRFAAADSAFEDLDAWQAYRVHGAEGDVPAGHRGIWWPPDEIMAACGVIPSDDWRQCAACAEVRRTDLHWLHGDDDECDDCFTEIPDV